MPDDPDLTLRSADDQRRPADAETLASLLDGTVTLEELPDDALGRLLRTIGPEALLHAIGTSPKLFPGESERVSVASRRNVGHAIPVAHGRPSLVFAAAAVVLLAATVGLTLYLGSRPAPATTGSVGATGPRPTAATGGSSESAAALPAPVMLTARAGDVGGTRPAEFRGITTDGREPRTDGRVVEADEERIDIDLGALDGLDKGARLDLFRDGAPVGTVTIDRVFRERASGTAPAGAVRVGDAVRVPLTIQMTAFLSAASDRLEAGDQAAARLLTQRVIERAGTAPATATVRIRALAQLGALDREAGSLDSAEASLRRALLEIDGGARVPVNVAADIRNELGVVLIGRRQIEDAVRILRGANERATGATAVRVANNLGAALALSGDRQAAEQQYRQALDRAAGAPALDRERLAIQQNLDGLSRLR